MAYQSLSQAHRRQLHSQVGQALERLHADNHDPVSGQIAANCEAAGQVCEAIAYYLQAAGAAQAVSANNDTLAYLRRAIKLFSQANLNQQQQIAAYEQLGDVLARVGESSAAEEAYRKVTSRLTSVIELSRLQRKRRAAIASKTIRSYFSHAG